MKDEILYLNCRTVGSTSVRQSESMAKCKINIISKINGKRGTVRNLRENNGENRASCFHTQSCRGGKKILSSQ